MHKEWVRISEERKKLHYREPENRPKKYRYIEEHNADDDSWIGIEYWEDVPDEKDEPQEDGLYEDNNEDRWIRMNGLWVVAPNAGYGRVWYTWYDRAMEECAPFTLVDFSNY